jgi:hypothetical protein
MAAGVAHGLIMVVYSRSERSLVLHRHVRRTRMQSAAG